MACSFCAPDRGLLDGEESHEIGQERQQSCDTGPLDQVEAVEEGLGFDEVDEETPEEIGEEEEAKGCAFGVGVAAEGFVQEGSEWSVCSFCAPD